MFIYSSVFLFLIKVTYLEKDSSNPVITRDASQAESAVLSPLNPYTLYVINVSAFTRKGEGSRSAVLEQTDEGRE